MTPTHPALASACAAIKACATVYIDVPHYSTPRLEWDDAALTALVASLLPPEDATVVVPHDALIMPICKCGHESVIHRTGACGYWTNNMPMHGCSCRVFTHDHDRITYTRRRTPGEEQ